MFSYISITNSSDVAEVQSDLDRHSMFCDDNGLFFDMVELLTLIRSEPVAIDLRFLKASTTLSIFM